MKPCQQIGVTFRERRKPCRAGLKMARRGAGPSRVRLAAHHSRDGFAALDRPSRPGKWLGKPARLGEAGDQLTSYRKELRLQVVRDSVGKRHALPQTSSGMLIIDVGMFIVDPSYSKRLTGLINSSAVSLLCKAQALVGGSHERE
jgi:hypothetical protein